MRSASTTTASPAPRPGTVPAPRPGAVPAPRPGAAPATPGSGPHAEPRRRRETRSRWLASGIAAAGIGLIPWMVILARTLPSSARAAHWGAAWVGLDALEALGLITTGLLLIRRDSRYCLTAAATAVLLLTDAWLDTATAPPGREQLLAAGLALFAELPTAAICGALAISGSRRLEDRRDRRPGGRDAHGSGPVPPEPRPVPHSRRRPAEGQCQQDADAQRAGQEGMWVPSGIQDRCVPAGQMTRSS